MRRPARLSSGQRRIKGMSDSVFAAVLAWARRRARVVFVAAATVGVAGIFLVSRVTFDANILRLLPQRSPAVHSFDSFLQDFGSLDHLYMLFESADQIGEHADLVDAFVLDEADASLTSKVEALGIKAIVLPTVMRSDADRAGLAEALLEAHRSMLR